MMSMMSDGIEGSPESPVLEHRIVACVRETTAYERI